MGATHPSITPELQTFIEKQRVFFVATAPQEPHAHINLSPKGLDTFRILSPNRVAYLDLTGSGNETAAHLTQNGRITLMFCAFEGKPLILRLYGRGTVRRLDYPELAGHVPILPGARQFIVIDITRVQTSCGIAVPTMDFESERDGLTRWALAKGEPALQEYRNKMNRQSIDGIECPAS